MSIIEILDGVEIIAIIVTVGILIFQVSHNTKALSYQIYQRLNDRYTEILWMASQDPVLNGVWVPLTETRKKQLDIAQSNKEWGAWFELDDEEQKQYRLVRLVFEICEQAYTAYDEKWVKKDLWSKWEDTMRIWKRSRFFEYAIEDARPRFQTGFLKLVEQLREGDTNNDKQT